MSHHKPIVYIPSCRLKSINNQLQHQSFLFTVRLFRQGTSVASCWKRWFFLDCFQNYCTLLESSLYVTQKKSSCGLPLEKCFIQGTYQMVLKVLCNVSSTLTSLLLAFCCPFIPCGLFLLYFPSIFSSFENKSFKGTLIVS